MDQFSDKLKIFEQILANNWTAIVFAEPEGEIKYANRAAYELYGYEGDELLGQHVDIFNSQKTHNTQDIINGIMSEGGWTGELIQRRKDGSTFHALLTVWLVYDKDGVPLGYASNSKDISSSKQTQNELVTSLKEKEVLLAEVHHRVKNNLQLISSLLNLQSSFISNDKINEALSNLQARIRAMSLIHERLYTANVTRINVRKYTSELFRTIVQTNQFEVPVDLQLDIDEITLEIEKMLPLGLMLNELITNTIKHAFKGMPSGRIKIDVKKGEDDSVKMAFTDNGSGFKVEAESNGLANSFGSLLITTFAEQLDGQLQVESGQTGTRYSLLFAN